MGEANTSYAVRERDRRPRTSRMPASALKLVDTQHWRMPSLLPLRYPTSRTPPDRSPVSQAYV